MSNSGLEYANATSITDNLVVGSGTVLDAGYAIGTAQVSEMLSPNLRMGMAIDGTALIYAIAVTRLSGSGTNAAYASMTIGESD